MSLRCAVKVGGVLVTAVGAVVFAQGFNGPYDHQSSVGVMMILTGFLAAVSAVLAGVFGSAHSSQDESFRLGDAVGYDRGWTECAKTKRPVVVPIVDRRKCCSHCSDAKPPTSCDGQAERRISGLPVA